MEAGAEITSRVVSACERRQPPKEVKKMIEEMSEYLAEDTPHSTYARAIINGIFISVESHVTENTSVLEIKNTIDRVFNTYGRIITPYANTNSLQIQVIETVERKCHEPHSPLFPVFGYIIQVLANHCVDFEAIQIWKNRRNKEREEGALSPREVALLTNLQGTPIGPAGAIFQGHNLGQASQDAKNMGF